jgi:hypothetical protein
MSKKGNAGLIVAAGAGAGLILLGMTRKSTGGYRGKAAPDVDVTGKSPVEKRKRTRKPSEIKGITLHQTGIHNFGEKAWPKVTAHVGVHSDGRVFLIHPLLDKVWHGHTLNTATVGIEVAGNYPRNPQEPHKYWTTGGGPSELTPEVKNGIKRAMAFIKKEIHKLGGDITGTYAHRQASKDRGGCPGGGIWQAGAIWAERGLGIKTFPMWTNGGYTIPDYWDPRVADLKEEAKMSSIPGEVPVLSSLESPPEMEDEYLEGLGYESATYDDYYEAVKLDEPIMQASPEKNIMLKLQ